MALMHRLRKLSVGSTPNTDSELDDPNDLHEALWGDEQVLLVTLGAVTFNVVSPRVL